jgi:hypothetical protein
MSDIQDTIEAMTDLVKAKPGKPQAYELNPYSTEYSAHYSSALLGDQHQGTTGALSYATLRALARVPLISGIIQTRVSQVAEFARPQPDRHSAGFVIRLRDQSTELTDEHREEVKAVTEWILKCGDSRIVGHQTFEGFLRAITRDSLTLDQCCFEVIHKGGRPAAFKAVDSATIRRAAPTEAEIKAGQRDPKKTAFVQVLDHRVVAEFDADQMAFGIRRPRSEITSNGYGYPEIEEAAPTIIDMVRAKAYNSANFTHGLHLSGILAIKSKMSPALFRAFRREFYSMLQGGNGAKKTPIIQLDPEAKEEVQSVNMTNSNSDMEYSSWLNFLIKEVCALYQMDPAELGYVFGNEGQSSALNQGGPAQRIEYSKEKGLRPLLRALETWLNRWLIAPLAPHLELSFVGLDAESESQRLDAISKKVNSYMTVNEARAAFDLEPLDNPVADMLLNPSYINAAQMAAAGDEGEEDEGEEIPGLIPPGAEPEDTDDDIEIDEEFGA